MIGFRTYISAGLIALHQILKLFGYDIPNDNLSTAFDTVASLFAIIFRALARPK